MGWEAQPCGQNPLLCSRQDPSANVETLLWKHKVLERGLEAQAEKISALEVAAHSLQRGGHPEAQRALGQCQALLLRYLWLRAVGGISPQHSCPAQHVITQGR